jgi:hypothetical protein
MLSLTGLGCELVEVLEGCEKLSAKGGAESVPLRDWYCS